MMTNTIPGSYSLYEAHADGRHASSHPEDRAFFVKAGCARCAEDFTAEGLPIVRNASRAARNMTPDYADDAFISPWVEDTAHRYDFR